VHTIFSDATEIAHFIQPCFIFARQKSRFEKLANLYAINIRPAGAMKLLCIRVSTMHYDNLRASMTHSLPRQRRHNNITRATGGCLVSDFTCSHTLAASFVNRAVPGQGIVATDTEERKAAKYSSLAANYICVHLLLLRHLVPQIWRHPLFL
jgi:hypothetical protein